MQPGATSSLSTRIVIVEKGYLSTKTACVPVPKLFRTNLAIGTSGMSISTARSAKSTFERSCRRGSRPLPRKDVMVLTRITSMRYVVVLHRLMNHLISQYSNPQTYNITEQDQVDYLLWWSKTARKEHLVVNLKNAGNLLVDSETGNATKYQADLVEAFDYNVLEQCVSTFLSTK